MANHRKFFLGQLVKVNDSENGLDSGVHFLDHKGYTIRWVAIRTICSVVVINKKVRHINRPYVQSLYGCNHFHIYHVVCTLKSGDMFIGYLHSDLMRKVL